MKTKNKQSKKTVLNDKPEQEEFDKKVKEEMFEEDADRGQRDEQQATKTWQLSQEQWERKYSLWGWRSDGKEMTYEEYHRKRDNQEGEVNDKEENGNEESEMADTGEEVQACNGD